MLRSALAFAAVAALLTITPGADTALVVRTALTRTRRSALTTAAGVCTGLLGWGLATVLGISALLAASRPAYDALRLVGAAYLLYLGIRALWSSRRTNTAGPGEEPLPHPTGQARSFRAGMLCNLFNPKVGAFYVTFLPQFIPDGARPLPTTALYVAIHAGEGMVWLATVTILVDRARAVLASHTLRRRLDQITGVVLVGFGVRLALDAR